LIEEENRACEFEESQQSSRESSSEKKQAHLFCLEIPFISWSALRQRISAPWAGTLQQGKRGPFTPFTVFSGIQTLSGLFWYAPETNQDFFSHRIILKI